MWWVFFVCAVAGTTVFVLQFLLSLLGLGAEHLDFDLPADLDHDVDMGAVDHLHGVGSHDPSHIEGHGSTRLFGMISIRTVTAAVAFFGLAGIGMLASGRSVAAALAVALGSGFLAMYVVHYLMRQLVRLRHDGTVRMESMVGETGSVYIPVPGNHAGRGKVQLRTPHGIVECAAVTDGAEELPTGTVVEVVDVLEAAIVQVEPLGGDHQA